MMKQKIEDTELKEIRKILLASDTDAVLLISGEDVDWLFDAQECVSYASAQATDLKTAVKELKKSMPELEKAAKAILLVSYGKLRSLSVREMMDLSSLVQGPAAIRYGVVHAEDTNQQPAIFAVATY